MDISTLDLPAPAAPRLRRPGWRDPRLLAGLALVAGSVALGSWVVRNAEASVGVYAVRDTVVPGDAIGPDDLVVTDARLGSGLDRYLRADEPLPEGAVVLRTVGAGELLPRAALGSADELALRPVAVPVRGELPDVVRTGAQVDLWLTPGQGAPEQLAAALTVAQVARPDGAFAAGGSATVHVLVPQDQLPDVLAALAGDGRVDVVAVPGS